MEDELEKFLTHYDDQREEEEKEHIRRMISMKKALRTMRLKREKEERDKYLGTGEIIELTPGKDFIEFAEQQRGDH